MSIVLYYKNRIICDSGSVISGRFSCYPNLFNTNKVKKLKFSSSGKSVFCGVGSLMSVKEDTELADMLENTIISMGTLNSADDTLCNYLKNLSRRIDCTLNMFFMTSVDRSRYFINVSRGDEGFDVEIAELSSEDVVTLGSGGLMAFTAINAGLSPEDAVAYTITNDPNSSGPIRCIGIDDLN